MYGTVPVSATEVKLDRSNDTMVLDQTRRPSLIPDLKSSSFAFMTKNVHEADHGPPDTYIGRISYRAQSMNEDISARTHYPPQNSMLYTSHIGTGASLHLGVQQNHRNAPTEYIPSLSSHHYVARNDQNTAFSDERNLAFWGTNVGRSDCVLNPLDPHYIVSSASGNRDQEIAIPMQKVDQKAYVVTQNLATAGYATARFSYPATHLENLTSTNQTMHKSRYVSSGHSEVISDYFSPRESGSMQLPSKIEQSHQRRTSYYERDPLESPDGITEQEGECDLRQKPIEGHHYQCDYHNCPNRARVLQMYGKFCNRHVIVAPCGFPGCRDKAAAKFSMCTKHISLGKEALHDVLANRAQNVPVCKTLGCFKNDQGRGYCRGHEKLLMATGRLPKHISKRRLNSAYTMCSFPDCVKHSQRNHLCRTHGNLIIRQAKELSEQPGTVESYDDILTRLQNAMRRCTHPNCTKNSQRDRLCTMHFYEKMSENPTTLN